MSTAEMPDEAAASAPTSRETYTAHLNAQFSISSGVGDEIDAELVEVSEPRVNGRIENFSLLFLTEPIDAAEQGSYVVSHRDLGKFELFLVPVGRTDDGRMELAAVFNVEKRAE